MEVCTVMFGDLLADLSEKERGVAPTVRKEP
jgi:hypothetical protein